MNTLLYASNFIHRVKRTAHLAELFKSISWLKVESKQGASAIEYGLLAALIALVIIGAVTAVGVNLSSVFTSISSSVQI